MGQIFTCFTNNNLWCKETSYSSHQILDNKYIHSYNRHHYNNYNYYNDDDDGTYDL